MGKKEEEQDAKLSAAAWESCWAVAGPGVCMLFLLGASAAISGGLLEDLTYQITIVGCVLGGFCGGLLAVGAAAEGGRLTAGACSSAAAHPGGPVL